MGRYVFGPIGLIGWGTPPLMLAKVGIVLEEAAVAEETPRPGPDDLEAIDASPVRCFDPAASEAMVAAIERAGADGDSLGGVVEVITFGVPPGLGSHVHWDRKLDGRLAAGLMAVPAIKGVELGDGFALAARRGSESHDEIETDLSRATDRAGGTEGGMTIGGTLRVRAAMKPLSTLKRRLRSVDLATGEAADAFQERTDVCAVPAAGVVCEAVVALVRERRDVPGALVLLADGRYALTGPILAVGSRRALIDWARASPRVEKIELRVRSSNHRAIGLYRALGFLEEGRFRHRIKLGPDKYVDDVSMAASPCSRSAT